MAESADATDLKSVDGDIVRVRPPLAPQQPFPITNEGTPPLAPQQPFPFINAGTPPLAPQQPFPFTNAGTPLSLHSNLSHYKQFLIPGNCFKFPGTCSKRRSCATWFRAKSGIQKPESRMWRSTFPEIGIHFRELAPNAEVVPPGSEQNPGFKNQNPGCGGPPSRKLVSISGNLL